jgi:hypothetical protein
MFFHQALVNGDHSQKELTLADAGELMDDLCPMRVHELTNQVTFMKNLTRANAEAAGEQAAKAN